MAAPIAILGANGVYGRHLTPMLIAAGHSVRAIVRRPEAANAARACDADVKVADIFDASALRSALAGCDLCINLATSLPGPRGRGDYDVNDRVRREGVPILIAACQAAGLQRLLQQSIAMVGASGDILADETAVYLSSADDAAGRAIRAALEMEATVRASDLDWTILRGGLFYGPGTGFDEDWFTRAAAGKLRLPGDGSDFVSLVDISDMCAATVLVVTARPSGQTLIVADDAPARWRDVFGYVAALVGAPAPQTGGRRGFPSFRMSNRRARVLLGWRPHYFDYRAGLAR